MRKVYGQLLRPAFESRLRSVLPDAKQLVVKGRRQPTSRLLIGETVYEATIPPITVFVLLRPHPNQDEFFIDIGWSRSGAFNPKKPGKSPLLDADDRSELQHNEFYSGLNLIVYSGRQQASHTYSLWRCSVDPLAPGFKEAFFREYSRAVSEADAAKSVSTAVDTAISDIRDLALPYFQEVAVTVAQLSVRGDVT